MLCVSRDSGRARRTGRNGHRKVATRLLAVAAATAAGSHAARSAVYVFDPGGQAPPTTASDGSGNWDGTTTDFYNVSSGLVGAFGNTTGDTAVFGSGGTAGTVTVGTVTTGTIDFNQVTGSYNLTGGTITLGTGALFADTGVTATIGSTLNSSVRLSKTGLGTINLTGADTFASGSGNSFVYAGTLVLGGAGAVTDTFAQELDIGGSNSVANSTTTLTIASGATVSVNGNFGPGGSDQQANQVLVANIAGTLNDNGNTLIAGYNSGANAATQTGVFNVTGTVSSGGLNLGITSGFTSVFNVNGGSTVITGGAQLGNNTGTLTTVNVTNGGSLNLSGGIANARLNENSGTLNINLSSGTVNVGGTGTFFYLTAVAGATTNITQTGGTFNVNGTGTNGLFYATGTASYNLAGGVLGVTNFRDNGSTGETGTFLFNGGTVRVLSATTENNGLFFSVPTSAQIGLGGGTFDTNGINATTAQAFTTGVSSGTDGGLTKIGAGTLTLAGASTYTGNTTVAAGRLVVTGSLASPVLVTGGILDGTGQVGAVTVSNNAAVGVNNGNGSAGTLTTGNLSFLGAATDTLFLTSADLMANGGVAVNVSGGLSSTTAGKVSLNFTGTVVPGSTYDLFQYQTFSGSTSGVVPTNYAIGTGLNGRVAGSSSLALTSTTGPGFLELIVGSADNNIHWTGASSNAWQTGQISPSNNFAYNNASSGTTTPYFDGDNVTFDDRGANTNPVNISAANVSPSSITFSNVNTTYNISSTGGFGIAGSGPLTKTGTGVLILNTSNSYTGGTAINAGTLDVGNAAALGTAGVTLGNGSGGAITLDNTSGAALTLTNGGVTINNDLTFVGSNTLTTGAGAGALNGTRTITVSASTLAINGALAGTGSLTKAGTGTLSLGANNTFGGGLTVNAGTVNLFAGGGAGAVSGPVTINAGGQVNAGRVDALGFSAGQSVNPLTVNAGGVFDLAAAGNNGYLTNLVLNGGSVSNFSFTGGASGGLFNFSPGFGITTLANAAQANISTGVVVRGGTNVMPINVASGSTTTGTDLLISGVITGDTGAGFVKLGSGTLTLTGANPTANTFTGTANVSAGVLNLSAGGGASTLEGAITIGNGAIVNAAVGDALGFNAGQSVTTLTVNQGGLFHFLAAANQGFLTNLVLAGGTVQSDVDKGDQTSTNGLPGQFNFNAGFGITALAVGTGPTNSLMDAPISLRNGAALPINTASGAILTATQAIIDNQFGSGAGSLVKSGAGTLIVRPAIDSVGSQNLNGNSYRGGTTISAGKLFADNDNSQGFSTGYTALGTGTTTIAAGATLGGDGFTGGPVTVNGTITGGPDGVAVGTLSTTTQAWNTGGGYVAKVTDTSGSNNDKLIMSGLTIASGFTVTLQPTNGSSPKFTANSPTLTTSGSQPAGSYIVLATDTESASPFASAATLATLTLVNNGVQTFKSGDSIVLSSEPDSGGFDLIAEDVAAPEPTSLLLAGVAAVPLVLGRRRRVARRWLAD